MSAGTTSGSFRSGPLIVLTALMKSDSPLFCGSRLVRVTGDAKGALPLLRLAALSFRLDRTGSGASSRLTTGWSGLVTCRS